ncbi:hypothetical protein ACJJIK_11225 [Microbulbifer sp. ZKSA006]|uniref:hypothetical protein n=1 Tax=Microbulbifer sp. ZKSA006 TaxID=3243390 RepID=UPI00403A0329
MGLKAALVGICTVMLISACATKPAVDEADARNDLAATSNGSTDSSESRLVCKVRSITGSRFKEKTCMTVEEWKGVAEASKNVVDSARRKGAQGNPGEY